MARQNNLTPQREFDLYRRLGGATSLTIAKAPPEERAAGRKENAVPIPPIGRPKGHWWPEMSWYVACKPDMILETRKQARDFKSVLEIVNEGADDLRVRQTPRPYTHYMPPLKAWDEWQEGDDQEWPHTVPKRIRLVSDRK